MTTSKKIIVASYIIMISLTVLTAALSVLGYDVMTLGTITGIAYAEVSVSNAFYFSKAKKENALKIALECIKEQPGNSQEVAALITALGGIV